MQIRLVIRLVCLSSMVFFPGCSAQNMDSTSCSRAMVNPSIKIMGSADQSKAEELIDEVLINQGFNRINSHYILSKYECFVKPEWADELNLTVAFYLPSEPSELEIPERVQTEVKDVLTEMVEEEFSTEFSVGEEIRLTEGY